MEIITRFDPANAQKAHNDTILAGPRALNPVRSRMGVSERPRGDGAS